MRKVILGFTLLLLLFGASSWAHEEQTPVIIDTDMALDDVRAIALMLSSQHLKVKAVVTSDGASSPGAGCKNLRRVLHFVGRDEIPVGAGTVLNAVPPPWREISEALGWAVLPGGAGSDSKSATRGAVKGPSSKTGPDANENSCSDSSSVIHTALSETEQGVSYICLGPLTNLAEVLSKDPAARVRIKSIFFYGTLPDEANPDWNISRDIEAARIVFAAGIPLYIIHLAGEDLLTFDPDMLAEIQKLDSRASRLLSLLHRDERVSRLVNEGHFKAWDESVALYMDNPRIGSFEKANGKYPVFRLTRWEKEAARASYLEILARSNEAELEERIPVVLESYPLQPSQFQEDLRPWVPRIIALHGAEEWKATVLTNELHRHLGIYSILGAKMGILAREILNASLDELTVESHAGLKPPLSCLNDGLQVATGASLGRGTITTPENGRPTVEAVFAKGDRKLRLRLKDSVKDRIRKDIQGAIERYGDLTPEYFKEVRRLSFEYWTNMKRGEIFDRKLDPP